MAFVCQRMEVCIFQRSYDIWPLHGEVCTYLHFVSIKLEYLRDFKGLFGGEHKINMINYYIFLSYDLLKLSFPIWIQYIIFC